MLHGWATTLGDWRLWKSAFVIFPDSDIMDDDVGMVIPYVVRIHSHRNRTEYHCVCMIILTNGLEWFTAHWLFKYNVLSISHEKFPPNKSQKAPHISPKCSVLRIYMNRIVFFLQSFLFSTVLYSMAIYGKSTVFLHLSISCSVDIPYIMHPHSRVCCGWV